MSTPRYRKLLKSPKWKRKRAEIVERDGRKCVKCGSPIKIHVHHIAYVMFKSPWEVPDHLLITWCEQCHNEHHRSNKNIILNGKLESPTDAEWKKWHELEARESRRRKGTVIKQGVTARTIPKPKKKRRRRGWKNREMQEALKWDESVKRKSKRDYLHRDSKAEAQRLKFRIENNLPL